ncbi:hypothetical protein [Sphingomonas xinjiangensis]|uniref:Uncharacterized protein n=1 Tax=Sphingomonas xinjiangensis TaxID=643568 RepID=A0A840YDE6_9SPHN|nr:hypothetical protein [Sphingomonas xinjiangensis]MBB5710029.1 hypothetical protein [Sphingomonas xinjiangensis]
MNEEQVAGTATKRRTAMVKRSHGLGKWEGDEGAFQSAQPRPVFVSFGPYSIRLVNADVLPAGRRWSASMTALSTGTRIEVSAGKASR